MLRSDPSLLSAELEEGGEETLRRLLLQVPPEGSEPPPPSCTVTPKPGFCVKTWSLGGDKVFLNVCHSQEVPPPPPLTPPDLKRLLEAPPGGFRIPMSLGEPHAELDRGGRGCTAFDVVVNSGFCQTLQRDPPYLELFLTVAMEGLEEKYGVELELTGWRVLKNRKFLGSVSTQRIRTRPRPQIQELEGPPRPPPQFVVLGVPSAQDPKVLQARVLLPHSEGSLWLGLSRERLVVGEGQWGEGEGQPPAHPPPLLDLALPLPPDPARARAAFQRATKVLTVTMPLQS